MLILQAVTYSHPNKDLLFADLNLIVNRRDKIALIGNNGSGKSTLLKIMAGQLHPSGGLLKTGIKPYYVPQHFVQFSNDTIAQALQIETRLKALKEILDGGVTDANLALLDEDWMIEERCKEALAGWNLDGLDLNQKMQTLSGGQQTRALLAGIMIHRPEFVLLDEPGNHLDTSGRNLLYDYVKTTSDTLVLVSHDRTLLNLPDIVYELSEQGIKVYGGNYDFYAEQKMMERNALNQDLRSKEKALRKAKETERESLDRQQRSDARGKKKQEKAGLPIISMNTFRNNAERSTSRMKGVHAEKVYMISQELNQLGAALPAADKMKMDFDHSALHEGKILVAAKELNFGYGDQLLWKRGLSFQIRSGERIAVRGLNGSGKTTLIKMILGSLQPRTGSLMQAMVKAVYIDQDYSFIDNQLNGYEQVQKANSGALQEHEIKIRLNRFLFTKTDWTKSCAALRLCRSF